MAREEKVDKFDGPVDWLVGRAQEGMRIIPYFLPPRDQLCLSAENAECVLLPWWFKDESALYSHGAHPGPPTPKCTSGSNLGIVQGRRDEEAGAESGHRVNGRPWQFHHQGAL